MKISRLHRWTFFPKDINCVRGEDMVSVSASWAHDMVVRGRAIVLQDDEDGVVITTARGAYGHAPSIRAPKAPDSTDRDFALDTLALLGDQDPKCLRRAGTRTLRAAVAALARALEE